jgi:hypothetical protein
MRESADGGPGGTSSQVTTCSHLFFAAKKLYQRSKMEKSSDS